MVTACTESAFLPLCCGGVVRLARILCEVMAQYPDPDGSYGFQGSGMKNCRPVARLQILSGNKKTAPQGTKGFCRGQAAAKWFGVVAERRFIIVKWLIGVRGYHGRGKVSMACLEVWTFSRIHYAGFVESHKNETFPARHPFYSSTASNQYSRETKSPSCCAWLSPVVTRPACISSSPPAV